MKLFELFPGDRDVGEAAEPRRQAVDALPAADRAVDYAPRRGDRPPSGGRERHAHVPFGNADEIVQRELGPCQGEPLQPRDCIEAGSLLSCVVFAMRDQEAIP